MQQTTHCPNCNSPVSEGQQFCGVCGTRLPEIQEPQVLVCPGCGVQITAEQQFCGMCGTKLSGPSPEAAAKVAPIPTEASSVYVSPATPVEVAPRPAAVVPPPVQEAVIPPEPEPAPPPASIISAAAAGQTQNSAPVKTEAHTPAAAWTTPSSGGYSMLRITAVVFQIFGWIVLIGGCLASIALGVLAGMGWTVSSLFTGQDIVGGMAVGIAVGGFILSLLYGLGMLAFAKICEAVVDFRSSSNF